MKMKLRQLKLINRRSVEEIQLAERVSFFHGEMGAGKSSIPALIDYCLGGGLTNTPALRSELVSVQLNLMLGENDVLIERAPSDKSYVSVSWETPDGERFQCATPLAAQASPVFGDTIYNLSDLILYLLGIGVIKVRKRSSDPDSTMVRLSIRDLLEFVYLDQDHLDSDFFLLDTPIRKEKSQDAIRYCVGYMSEKLSELENKLQELRQDQRGKREAVAQIHQFLQRFEFGSEDKITHELTALNDEARTIEMELERLEQGYRPEAFIADDDRARLDQLTRSIAETREALDDLNIRIREQEGLESELISLKFKAARTAVAHAILDDVSFDACPACGTDIKVASKRAVGCCYLCKTPDELQQSVEATSADVIRQDLDARIADLKQSTKRHRRAVKPLTEKLEAQLMERHVLEGRLSSEARRYESEYLARSRQHEKRLAAIQERSMLLEKIRAMPAEVEKVHAAADALNAPMELLRRQIQEEQATLLTAEENYKAIERNYKEVLLAIHFPAFTNKEEIVINRRTLIPEVLQENNPGLGWTFYDAGSGGKKTLLKICFALALHKTAAENGLPLPHFLIIDSPMKNITPDVNRDVFENFYRELYHLLGEQLRDWQLIIVDQTYYPPPADIGPAEDRLMLRDSDKYPPLIRYYRGA
ncbi:MAG: AAA family ATPase [Rhodospirillaceae bacterium]